MGPNRFKRDKRESTPFNDEPLVREEVPPEWRDIEAPINFTWVTQDELAGMGWPKSRDQVRFCVEQGIDHLISLSPEKLPPSYAFPKLKWTLIPVEDFTGPTIADIKKFITIMDEARKEGEAIGVHCAEGRGRTGVMCACYLIYYHDIKPWDAIRIMRRQRPGSVERKTQEETVVRFWTLIQDFGKSMLEELDEKDKELRQKEKLMSLNSNLNTYSLENVLLGHTAKFFAPGEPVKVEKRTQRAKSMPKFNQEEEEEINFRQHMQSFFLAPKHRSHKHERRSRSQSHGKRSDKQNDRNERSTTPGLSLIENLKPVRRCHRRPLEETSSNQNSCDLTKHFKDFMSSNSSLTKKKPPKHPSRSSSKKESQYDENKYSNNDTQINSRKPPLRSQSFNGERKCILDIREKTKRAQKEEGEEENASGPPRFRSESPSMSEDETDSSCSGSNSSSCTSSRRTSICSSSDEVSSSSSSRSSSPFTTSSSDNGGTSTFSDISSSKKMPSPPPFKPKFTVENVSSTTYAYYTRIRTKAAAARESRTGEALPIYSSQNKRVIPSSESNSSRRNSDSRFRRAQTEISDRTLSNRQSNSFELDNKYCINNSTGHTSTAYFRPSNSIAVDRALSSLRCGTSSSNVLNRRFRADKTLEYPTPLARDSWKRTNHRYNSSRFVSTTPEAYV